MQFRTDASLSASVTYVPMTGRSPPAVLPVSVVVPVKNEERNLSRCLASLDQFAEIIVVDSRSGDRTCEIARSAGATVVVFDWNGRFPKKRNWLLLNHPPRSPWVLFLDADEAVTPAFCEELAHAIADPGTDGYWLNYTNYFLGRRLRYGVAQKKLALFRPGKGLYERIEEDNWSKLDMEVHEHPVIDGRVGEIRSPIEHNDDRGLADFIDRHRDYAAWEARRALALEGSVLSNKDVLTRRQIFKYRYVARWWYPWCYFAYAYIIKRGFLDGAAGFHYAAYKTWYFSTVRLMIRELKRASNGARRDLAK